jgi:hypothetical protein
MAETHINSYFADVDAAAAEVRVANGKYQEARARLEAKKKEVDWKEPEPTPESHGEQPQATETKESHGIFNKKK